MLNCYKFPSCYIIIDDGRGEIKIVASHMNFSELATSCIVKSFWQIGYEYFNQFWVKGTNVGYGLHELSIFQQLHDLIEFQVLLITSTYNKPVEDELVSTAELAPFLFLAFKYLSS